MSGQIFISYRREDSKAWAGRLSDHLGNRFPSYRIFMDVDSIEPGEDFVKAIEKTVGDCDVLIAVIGKGWLTASNQEGQRRLDNSEDLVRTEIATALKRDIRVIPVLVDGASMPHSGDLPDDLKALARRNALQLSHDRFRSDSALLETAVERILENTAAGRHERGEKERTVLDGRMVAPSVPTSLSEAGKRSAEVPKTVYPPSRKFEPRPGKPPVRAPDRIRPTSPAKLIVVFSILAAVFAIGALIYLATRPLQSPSTDSAPTLSSPSQPAKATPIVAATSPSPVTTAGSPVKTVPVTSTQTPGARSSLGEDVTASLDSVKPLNDGMRSLEIFITFENRSAGEIAIYVGNPMRQNGPPYQVLALSLTDSSRVPYEVRSVEGTTTLAEESVDPHRIYSGLNRYVAVPSQNNAQVRLVFWPSRTPPEAPTSIDFAAEFRLLTDTKNRRTFDRALRFSSFKIEQTDPDEGNAAVAAAETAKSREPKFLSGDIAATLNSVRFLSDGMKSLEVYVTLENHSPGEIAVYIGNPMRQNGPPFQVLAASLTDNLGTPYEIRSVEGVTTLADGSVDPHRIYSGLNRYAIVPAKGDAQVRFVFWPYRAHPEQPSVINFTAELRVLRDVKTRQTFDRMLRFPSFRIATAPRGDSDEGNLAGTSAEAPASRRSKSLGGEVTARVDSVKSLNDGVRSLEIFLTFENHSADEIAVYMSNPMRQNGPPFQVLAASVSDNSGMPYEVRSLEGVTTLSGESVDRHRIYNGQNRYVVVPSKGDAQVRFVFWPYRAPPSPPTSINFTAEFRVLTDIKSSQAFERTLNILDCPVE
jgi:hypothetical protein